MISWAIYSLLRLPADMLHLCMRGLDSVFHLMIFLGVFVGVAHRIGWVDRLIWSIGEREATRVCNGAPVTCASMSIDWTRALEGRLRITVHNVVIHSPDRDAWRWSSPLVARIGVAVVDCNLITTLLNLAIRQVEIPAEIYSVRLVDIQVFVERRQHIFNFYLLDPALIIPDPKDVVGSIGDKREGAEKRDKNASKNRDEKSKEGLTLPNVDSKDESSFGGAGESRDDNDDDKRSIAYSASYESAPSSPISPTYQRRSKILIDTDESIAQVQADNATEVTLETTSLAVTTEVETTIVPDSPKNTANSGTASPTLSPKQQSVSAPPEQAQAQQLVQDMLQAVKSFGHAATQTGSFHGALQRNGRQWADTLRKVQEPGKLLQHVGKVAAESFQEPSSPRATPMLLPERKTSGLPTPVYGRVGRILIQSMRIFTRETWESGAGAAQAEPDECGAGAGWSKPITIQQVLLRASDLCPPGSLTELAEHGDPSMPAIYQPLDKIAEVLQRRVLTEMAKTNTGKLFRTAMGEFVGLVKLANTSGGAATVSTAATVPRASTPVQQQ